jgi:hypothetical protein
LRHDVAQNPRIRKADEITAASRAASANLSMNSRPEDRDDQTTINSGNWRGALLPDSCRIAPVKMGDWIARNILSPFATNLVVH